MKGQCLPIRAAVVPGVTPFLVARPTLESWKVKQDYENSKIKIWDSVWFSPEGDQKRHYIFDLLDVTKGKADAFTACEHHEAECKDIFEVEEGVMLMEENYRDGWRIEPNMEMPHFIWMAPPCTIWTPLQQLNALDEWAREVLRRNRVTHG